MFRGRGACAGNRLTTYIVFCGSLLSWSALITLESGVLSNRPPSQYGRSPPPRSGGAVARVGGKLGGRLPLASTCAAVSCICLLSKRSSRPERRLVAVSTRRGARG